MRVLLTSVAHGRWWAGLERPGVEPLLLGGGGELTLADGSPVERHAAGPEVAWGTSDLFAEEAPLRPFFGLLRRAETLRWFQSPAAGYDGVVFAELARRGVRISNAHVNGIPIAEYVLRSVLEHFQRAGEWRAAAGAREWRAHDFREVYGTTWLVVGLGSIGGAVAVRARAFGARVIGCRRRPRPDDPTDLTVTPDRLPQVVADADVVVLAAPATAATSGLVDAGFLAAMRPGSLLVNVARGSLVDEEALLAALGRGTPEGAVLDVFATEPLPPEHPFWDHPAVTVTPHNAAGGTGRHGRQAELFSENLDRYLAGRPLINDVTDLVLEDGLPGG